MKKSRFLLRADTGQGTSFLKHMANGSVLLLPNSIADDLESGSFQGIEPDSLQTLIEFGMVLDQDIDEGEIFTEDYKRLWEENHTFLLHIVPTTNCQLDCGYCYEKGICRSSKMSVDTEEKTIDWMDRFLEDNKHIELIRIIWHGGEPLLAKPVILAMMSEIQRVTNKHGLPLETQIVTNAVLLSEKFLEGIKPYNLKRLQVTLDGPPQVHDQRRWFKVGHTGSFDIIYRNIRNALLGGYIDKIDLRVNIDKRNRGMIAPLFDRLSEDKLISKINLSIGIITGTIPTDQCDNSDPNYFEQYGLTDDEAVDTYLETATEAKKRGIVIPDEFIVGPWCVARHPFAWTIGPDGELYKCLSTVGRKDMTVGNIPDYPSKHLNQAITLQNIEQCLKRGCNVLPVCGGGCLFDKMVNGESSCPKKVIEGINRGLLLLKNPPSQ